MSQSLRARWTLALVAVGLVQAVVMGWALRRASERAFERFLVEESFVLFEEHVAEYVRQWGTLGGLRVDSFPSAQSLQSASAPLPLHAIRFGLVDNRDVVVLPFDGHEQGERLPRFGGGLPVEVDGRRVGTAYIPEDAVEGRVVFGPRTPEARYLRASEEALLWALLAGALTAVGFGLALSSRLVRPLWALTEAAGRVARGDLDTTVTVRSHDEIGQLAEAFNTMSAQLAQATLLRRRMTADISHDLRTPLATVLGTLEAIRDGVLPATPERLAAAHAEAARLGRLVQDLHTLALADAHELSVEITSVDVADVARQVACLFEVAAQRADVMLVLRAHPSVAQADRDRLVQVLDNLIDNAIRHTPPGGRVTLAARPTPTAVEVAVSDTGEGIAPEMLPIVFERSVQADAARANGSSGLGLSIVRSLVEAMGGDVSAASVPGEGTTVTVRLPPGRPALLPKDEASS